MSEENKSISSEPTTPLSFGEKLVGLTFNPSGDDKVGRVKKLFAQIADIMQYEYQSKETTGLYSQLHEHTIGEILNAQMNCVKVLTLKY